MKNQEMLLFPRSELWNSAKRRHLKREPVCQFCGGKKMLQVHHIVPVHIDPFLELVEENMITLCMNRATRCHFVQGFNKLDEIRAKH